MFWVGKTGNGRLARNGAAPARYHDLIYCAALLLQKANACSGIVDEILAALPSGGLPSFSFSQVNERFLGNSSR
jgi:hypothetical protein